MGRWALLIAALIAVCFVGVLAWIASSPEQYDPFGRGLNGDPDSFCRHVPKGGEVCAPATPAIKAYRAEQQRRRDGSQA
jgi:hypothetical protein